MNVNGSTSPEQNEKIGHIKIAPRAVPEIYEDDESVNFLQNPNSKKTPNEAYGWGGLFHLPQSLSPTWLQFMNNKKAFLVVYSLTCILQGTFHTYFVAVITTLEKLFSIPSRTTGFLMATTEIGQVSSALLLPYFISSGHRPRWMGFGTIIFAAATLLTASLHILLPPEIPEEKLDYCLSSDSTCKEGESNILLYLILSLSLLSIGFGKIAVHTLGIPYMDDNVESRESPVYFSITIGVRILGPVTGFILGSLTTRLYIYPYTDPGYDQTNPHWLGAWWLGMLLISILLFIISIFLTGFPKTLPNSTPPPLDLHLEPIGTRVKEGEEEANNNNLVSNPSLRNFPSAIKRLLRNRILLLRTLSSVFHLLPISGLYTFLPKYLESQFQLTAADAAMLTGNAGILVMGIGILSSGWFIRRWLPSAKGIALWIAICAGIYSLGMLSLMFVGCDGNQVVGGEIKGNQSECTRCQCDASDYIPLCGSDEVLYFSPCHAGCLPTPINGTYTDCSCIGDGVQTAKSNLCPLNCSDSNLVLYFIIFISIVLIHSTSEVGSMLLTLRCVKKAEKAMALGLVQFSIGLFGNVPCPILYGWIVDRSCNLWGKDCGGNSENCWIYENRSFREVFHGTTSGLMFIGFLIDLVIYFLADDIRFNDE